MVNNMTHVRFFTINIYYLAFGKNEDNLDLSIYISIIYLSEEKCFILSSEALIVRILLLISGLLLINPNYAIRSFNDK